MKEENEDIIIGAYILKSNPPKNTWSREQVERAEDGSYVRIAVDVVHRHACKFWRSGASWDECDCGARELFNKIIERHKA